MNLINADDIDFEKYQLESSMKGKVVDIGDMCDFLDASLDSTFVEKEVHLPFSNTKDDFQFRYKEITVLAASNGSGKSMLAGQIFLGLIQQGEKALIASFEMHPTMVTKRLLNQFAGEDVDYLKKIGQKERARDLIHRFKAFCGERLFLFNHQGTATPLLVVGMANYVASELGIKQILIDNLAKVVRGEDDMNGQKMVIDELAAVARDRDCHIHIVHHIRKTQDESAPPTKWDIKGSGAITDQADNVFLLWRNRKKESHVKNGEQVDPGEPDALLMNVKQRNGKSEEWWKLWYDHRSQQYRPDVLVRPQPMDEKEAF